MSAVAAEFLVTGAAGWLGRGLLSAFANGIAGVAFPELSLSECSVRGFCLASDEIGCEQVRRAGAQVVVGDVRDPESTDRFCRGAKGAVLLHAARTIHPKRVPDFYDVNLQGSVNVLKSAA